MKVSEIYIGIDNGVSGTIGIITSTGSRFFKTPVFKQMSYQKTKKTNINRVDFMALSKIFARITGSGASCFALIERPMINSARFAASMSAARCLEATLIILELYEVPYQYVDSKLWQKEFFPAAKGSVALKEASYNIGCRLFPGHQTTIGKHKDADGILIAEYARRKNL